MLQTIIVFRSKNLHRHPPTHSPTHPGTPVMEEYLTDLQCTVDGFLFSAKGCRTAGLIPGKVP